MLLLFFNLKALLKLNSLYKKARTDFRENLYLVIPYILNIRFFKSVIIAEIPYIMKKIQFFTLVIALFTCVSSCSKKSTTTSSSPEADAKARIKVIESSDKIEWMDYNEALALSKYKPKKIFIDVYTNWCGWCKRMDATSFKDARIVQYVNAHYYAVKLNAESGKTVTFNGKEITETTLATNVFGVTGFPTTVYLTPEEKVLQPIPGFLDVAMLNKILHFYGEDAYKTTTWDNFQMSFNE